MSVTAVLHPDPQKFPVGTTVKAYKRSDQPGVWNRTGAPAGTQDASATVASDGSVTFTGLTAQTDYMLYAATPDRWSAFSTKVSTDAASVYTGTQDFSGATVTLPSGLVVPADSVDASAIQAGAVGFDELASDYDRDFLTTGEETFHRALLATSAAARVLTTGALCLTFFTARKTETCAKLRVLCASAQSGTAPTILKLAVFSVAANGDGTQVGVTANDTAALASSGAKYEKALTASFTKTKGQRYAIGALVVSTGTVPNLFGQQIGNSFGGDTATAQAPRMCATFTGQTDMPSSFTEAGLTNTNARLYAVCLPS